MSKEKKSFFERVSQKFARTKDEEESSVPVKDIWAEEDDGAELAVDVHQTATEIVLIAMIAGVKPEDLDVNITREMVVIKARREEPEFPDKEKYLTKELYWGSFDRTIVLPDEVEADDSEAIEKHGLLIIRMPKINKNRSKTLKVKTL